MVYPTSKGPTVIEQALAYLHSLGVKDAKVETLDIGGRKYTNKVVQPAEDPMVNHLPISTLQSVIDLVDSGFDGFTDETHMLHVVSESAVDIIARKSNAWKKREVLAQCRLTKVDQFKFGQYLDAEEFIVGALSMLTQTDDRDYIIKIAQHLTTEKVTTSEDDGITQRVGQRTGVTMKGVEALRGRVLLAPYRTFRDVEQPTSEFIFRARQDDEGLPELALYESDGGKWRLTAIENIARFLRRSPKGVSKLVVVS